MVYYNEFDPKAAAWLRALMKAGHIAEGVVDERDIREVLPADVVGYARVHFFAGIGGFELALKLAGWPEGRPIFTGSCPCQPLSCAGKRRGEKDERHLWPEFYRIISECRPATAIGEQVASKDGLEWIDGVSLDLEELGYAVASSDLPSACVGAPNIRQRIYWVAHRSGERCDGLRSLQRKNRRFFPEAGSGNYGLAHSMPTGRAEGWSKPGRRPASGRGDDSRLAYTDGGNPGNGDLQRGGEHGQQPQNSGAGIGLAHPNGQHGDGIRFGTGDDGGKWEPQGVPVIENCVGQADTNDPGSQGRYSEVLREHPGELPARPSGTHGFWDNSIWHQCLDGKIRRISAEPAFFPLASGLSGRVAMLRGFGNAINPVLAAHFIRAFIETQTQD